MKEKKIILDIIEKVLNGELSSLNELYHLWPETVSNNEFYEGVYDDTESVIEHNVIKNKNPKVIDEKLFLKSIDFRNLIIDYKILKLDIEINLMKNLRNKFHKKDNLALVDLENDLIHYSSS